MLSDDVRAACQGVGTPAVGLAMVRVLAAIANEPDVQRQDARDGTLLAMIARPRRR